MPRKRLREIRKGERERERERINFGNIELERIDREKGTKGKHGQRVRLFELILQNMTC